MARDLISEQKANIDFVKQVEKHPCLYNFDLPSYARRDLTEKAWEDIGKTTNMSASCCKERWRNIRAVFIRTVKAKGKKKPYYLSEKMQFVKPFLRLSANHDSGGSVSSGQTDKVIEPAKDSPSEVISVEDFKVERENSVDLEPDTYQTYSEPMFTKKRPLQTEEYEPCMRNASIRASTPCDMNDAVRAFLDSLLPELKEMNMAQFKSFKRRVLVLVDDIMDEIPTGSRRVVDSERFITS